MAVDDEGLQRRRGRFIDTTTVHVHDDDQPERGGDVAVTSSYGPVETISRGIDSIIGRRRRGGGPTAAHGELVQTVWESNGILEIPGDNYGFVRGLPTNYSPQKLT